MPIPVPIIIAIAVALGGALGTVITLNWDKILVFFQGKTIAVLGTNRVGKTTLIKFLTEGWLPKAYKTTRGTERTKGERYRLKDLDLKLSKSKDVSGHERARDQWAVLVKNAEVLIYIVFADKLLANHAETVGRIEADMRLLRQWVQEAPNLKQCFIVGNFADNIPGFRSMGADDLVELEDRFQKHETIIQASMSLRTKEAPVVPVIVGSMASIEDTQDLVYALFKQVV